MVEMMEMNVGQSFVKTEARGTTEMECGKSKSIFPEGNGSCLQEKLKLFAVSLQKAKLKLSAVGRTVSARLFDTVPATTLSSLVTAPTYLPSAQRQRFPSIYGAHLTRSGGRVAE